MDKFFFCSVISLGINVIIIRRFFTGKKEELVLVYAPISDFIISKKVLFTKLGGGVNYKKHWYASHYFWLGIKILKPKK